MPVESFEKGEQQVCPVCGAPYYAECEHMKHPEKFADVHGKPAKIQLGSEGPETEEALAVHKELKEKIIPGETTAEELRSDDIETALEKLTEDERSFVENSVNQAIEENRNNPSVQKFLQFEAEQPILPKEVSRVKKARQSLIDSALKTLEQRKKLGLKGEDLEESLKKSVLSNITTRVEKGLPGLKISR